MRVLNPDHIRIVNQIESNSPFPSLLSMEMTEIGIGYSVIQLKIAPKHLQLMGVVHGGVVASLIDTAAWWAAYFSVEDPRAGLTSVDLKLNYLAPTRQGRLTARGRQLKSGKSLCYADVAVTDNDERLIAHGASTLMVVPDLLIPSDITIPPKFL